MIFRYQVQDKVAEINLERQGDTYRAIVDGVTYQVELVAEQPGVLHLRMDGRPVTLYWGGTAGKKWVSLDGCAYLLEKPARPRARGGADTAQGSLLRAPMPAQVLSIEALEGDWVEKGQTVLLLEAMKMEIRLQAPRPGRVIRLAVKEGQQVQRDDVLAEIGD